MGCSICSISWIPCTTSTHILLSNTYQINKKWFLRNKTKTFHCIFLVPSLGLNVCNDGLDIYAYGLSYLPLSTYALVCASQLGFNAEFTFFLNSQKFTASILNSIYSCAYQVSYPYCTQYWIWGHNTPSQRKLFIYSICMYLLIIHFYIEFYISYLQVCFFFFTSLIRINFFHLKTR